MTSKIKCPVCQNNLHKINIVVSTCTNDKCKLWGSSIPNLVLEALAQAKQDLEIARKALEEIKKHNKAMLSVLGEQIPKESTDTEEYCWWASCRIQDCLNALEQIEHKE